MKEKLDIDKILLSIQETRKLIELNSLEADKRFEELTAEHKKTELAQQKTELVQQETSKQIKELNKFFGGLARSNGSMAENIFVSTLEKTLSLNGWSFNSAEPDLNKFDKALNIREQYDLMLENPDKIALIEVKYKLQKEDLDTFLERKIPNYRLLYPHHNTKKIVPVVAALSYDKDALKEAKKLGVYAITFSGDSIKILNPEYTEL